MSVIKNFPQKQSVELSFCDISELTTATNTILLKPDYQKPLFFRFLSDEHGLISRFNSALNNTPEGAWKSGNFGMSRYWNDSNVGDRWTIATITHPPNGLPNSADYSAVANYTALLALPVEGLDETTFYLTLDNNRMYRWRASDNTFLYLFEPLTDLIQLTENVVMQNTADIETINNFLNQPSLGTFTVGVDDLATQMNAKAPQATTYTKTETDTLLNAKAPQTTTYTKTETDTLLNAKAPQTTTYTKTETDTLLNAKAPQVTTYTKAETDTLLNAKAPQTTTYTKTETDTLVNAKLNLSGGTMSGALAMGTNNISGVGTLTATTVTPTNVGGHAMTGNLAMGTHDISGVGTLTATTVTPTNVGGHTMTGALAMGTNNISGVGTLTATTVNPTNVGGHTMTGALAMGTNNISGVGTLAATTVNPTNLGACTMTGILNCGNYGVEAIGNCLTQGLYTLNVVDNYIDTRTVNIGINRTNSTFYKDVSLNGNKLTSASEVGFSGNCFLKNLRGVALGIGAGHVYYYSGTGELVYSTT